MSGHDNDKDPPVHSPRLIPPQRFDLVAGYGRPCGDALVDLRLAAGLTLDQVAAWTGRHRTTLARMRRGEHRADPCVLRLLALLAGVLPWAAWRGWSFRDGVLASGDDRRLTYTPRELALVTFAWQLAAAARAELRAAGLPEAEIARRLPERAAG